MKVASKALHHCVPYSGCLGTNPCHKNGSAAFMLQGAQRELLDSYSLFNDRLHCPSSTPHLLCAASSCCWSWRGLQCWRCLLSSPQLASRPSGTLHAVSRASRLTGLCVCTMRCLCVPYGLGSLACISNTRCGPSQVHSKAGANPKIEEGKISCWHDACTCNPSWPNQGAWLCRSTVPGAVATLPERRPLLAVTSQTLQGLQQAG